MIISKHVHYEATHDNYGALARYIADSGHEGEKCLMNWCAGCAADDDYELAIVEAQAVQALNTGSRKEKTYHLLVSFHPKDEAKLTPEVFKAIEERFAIALGFSEHQRHCGIHKNTNNIHMHIAYSMIHPERHTRHEPFRDYATRDKLCREIEREYSLAVDNGREQRRENALSQKASTIEAQTGQESFESYAKRHREKILEALKAATHWQDLHEALRTYGLDIKSHGNGLVVIDLHGKHTAKASTVDRALSAKRLQERFGEFQPYRNLRPIQELSRYQAAPLHRSPERGELYVTYKAGIETRKSRLTDIKEREDTRIAVIKEEWAVKRREIENMNIHKRNRRNLLALARKHEKESIAKGKLELLAERETVRREVPYTSWNAFLQHKAEQGNEVALAVLRSIKETVEPEREFPVAPKKDWSQHGREQFSDWSNAEARTDFAAQERAVLENTALTGNGKKALLAVLRMEQLVEEDATRGQRENPLTTEVAGLKYSVDRRGIVLFTLPGGGMIRDTGKEIFFSPQDAVAEIALRYGWKKWGKGVQIEGNRLCRGEEREQKRGMER